MQLQIYLTRIFTLATLLFTAVRETTADSLDRTYCYCRAPHDKPHNMAWVQTFHYHSNRIDKDYEFNTTCGPQKSEEVPVLQDSPLTG